MTITGVLLGDLGEPGIVVSKSRKDGSVVLSSQAPHNLSVGDKVIVSGLGAGWDGTFTVTAVAFGVLFSYLSAGANVVPTPATGKYQRSDGPVADISEIITSMSVSLTSAEISQVAITVADPGLVYMNANYFQLRQKVSCLGEIFEISVIEVSQGSAGETVVLECRLTGIQQLRRDKGSAVFTAGSATSFCSERARLVGLDFFGESTAAKSSISRIRNDTTDESTWDVIKRLAGDNQFMAFETGGRLFFTSQQFLLGKYAISDTSSTPGFLTTVIRWTPRYGTTVLSNAASTSSAALTTTKIEGPAGRPLVKKGSKDSSHVKYIQTVLKQKAGRPTLLVDGIFGNQTYNAVVALQRFFKIGVDGVVGPQTWSVIDFLASGYQGADSGRNYVIEPLECPTVRRSDDTYEEMTAQFRVEREVGRLLRPGMTITMEGIPGFTTNLLVSEVAWEEGTPDPVSVSATTPSLPNEYKKRQELLAKIDLTGGGFGNTAASGGFA